MRPVRPWRSEPTLRYLASLPLLLAGGAIVVEVMARAAGAATQPRPAWLLAVATGILHAGVLILLVPMLRAHGFRWRDAFGGFEAGWPRTWMAAVAWTIPAMLAAWMIHQGSGWVMEHLGIPNDNQAAVEAVRNADRWWERLLLFVFASLTAPVAEELIFRGVLWPLARDHGWRLRGALVVGLLFSFIHFNVAAFLPLWFLGIFWIWLYERTGDITAPILSHALFNAANFALILAVPGATQ